MLVPKKCTRCGGNVRSAGASFCSECYLIRKKEYDRIFKPEDALIHKVCPGCKLNLPGEDFHVGRRFESRCKACHKIKSSEYRKRNYRKYTEKQKAAVAKWSKENPEKRKKARRAAYEREREYLKFKDSDKDLERRCARCKKTLPGEQFNWYGYINNYCHNCNVEKSRLASKRYYHRHKEEFLKRKHKSLRATPERYQRYLSDQKKYRETHPEIVKKAKHEWYARKREERRMKYRNQNQQNHDLLADNLLEQLEALGGSGELLANLVKQLMENENDTE